MIAAWLICGLDLAASTATSSEASISSPVSLCRPTMRAMWRCVTWATSWAITPASSDSLWAARIRPVCTPILPPGIAKALRLLSSTPKNWKGSPAPSLTATRRPPRWLR